MSDHQKNPGGEDDEVGYGKPPGRTRFRKGQSGNPGGRPRGITAGRANALALKEAYRMLKLKVGDDVVFIPALQAIWRRQVALAANGNGPAQRAVIEMVQAIERQLALVAAAEAPEAKAKKRPMADRDLARRIAWILFTGVPNPITEDEPEATPETGFANDENGEE
jgi:Family of unknown function (DUF5681)